MQTPYPPHSALQQSGDQLMQLDLFVIICLHFTRQTFSLWNGDLTIIPAAALQCAMKTSHVLDFRRGLWGRANAPFIAQLERRDGWLWKITANLWNKKPWRNTDDEITPGTRRNAYRERCFSRGPKTDPQLCEIRRIFSSSVLKLLSKNPGKQLIAIATQLSAPDGPIGLRELR